MQYGGVAERVDAVNLWSAKRLACEMQDYSIDWDSHAGFESLPPPS